MQQTKLSQIPKRDSSPSTAVYITFILKLYNYTIQSSLSSSISIYLFIIFKTLNHSCQTQKSMLDFHIPISNNGVTIDDYDNNGNLF